MGVPCLCVVDANIAVAILPASRNNEHGRLVDSRFAVNVVRDTLELAVGGSPRRNLVLDPTLPNMEALEAFPASREAYKAQNWRKRGMKRVAETTVQVRVAPLPFALGSQRYAYHGDETWITTEAGMVTRPRVFKESVFEGATLKEAKRDIHVQSVAFYLAREYSKLVDEDDKVTFTKVQLYKVFASLPARVCELLGKRSMAIFAPFSPLFVFGCWRDVDESWCLGRA